MGRTGSGVSFEPGFAAVLRGQMRGVPMSRYRSNLTLAVAAILVWALLIAVSVAVGGESESRVCVSSVTASSDAQGNVVESKSPVACESAP